MERELNTGRDDADDSTMPRPAVLRAAVRRAALVRPAVIALAVGLALSGATMPTASSAKSILPKPQAPVVLPATAEEFSPYVPQSSCEPRMRKGVKRFRALMLTTYKRGADGGSTRACTAGGTSEHYEGRAWDWMLNANVKKDKKVAKAAIAWLLAPGPDGRPGLQARRLGVMYIMFDGRIWGVWSGTWKAISPGSHQHTDHIHLSFSWPGARGVTSFWKGKVAKVDYGPCAAFRGQPAVLRTKRNPQPCPSALPKAPRSTHKLAWTGSGGPDVLLAQTRLGMARTDRTSYFGTATRNAVIAFQQAKKLPVTGALDKATWVVLDPASKIA
jgi:hypothetical protein